MKIMVRNRSCCIKRFLLLEREFIVVIRGEGWGICELLFSFCFVCDVIGIFFVWFLMLFLLELRGSLCFGVLSKKGSGFSGC